MKLIQTAALTTLLLMAVQTTALAHAKMTASKPADGSTVTAGVSEIELNFSHPLRLSMVHVRDAAQHDVPLKSQLPTPLASVVKVDVESLTPGSYQVSWTAVAEDGHVMKGTFAFSVKADAAPAK
jgi:methionine-rich copper-binding protein CopC